MYFYQGFAWRFLDLKLSLPPHQSSRWNEKNVFFKIVIVCFYQWFRWEVLDLILSLPLHQSSRWDGKNVFLNRNHVFLSMGSLGDFWI
ncbi:hypothetical protein DRW42_25100 [Pedobacter miscanthi]|uniref:Uncharacterized protein n=1 Tax=Pedobacter miscanthi TaxID=2259170 RepID=A0A366KM10_9SPHI|nr:hypothetical protein DRW42_25100 [Pedobacter miscanthi]